jgi:hypothetical protein
MRIHGSCHCGNIAFDLAWEPDPAEIPARVAVRFASNTAPCGPPIRAVRSPRR